MRFFREILPTCKLTLTGRLFRPEKIRHHQPEIFFFFFFATSLFTTNTPRVLQVETTWKRPFQREIQVLCL